MTKARTIFWLTLIFVQGCVPIPIPLPQHDLLAGHGMIEEQAAKNFLKVGATTREEVLLRYGEPEEIIDGGRVFVYAWTRDTGIMPPGEDVLRTTLLLLEFDSGNHVTRYAYKPLSIFNTQTVRQVAAVWLRGDKKDSP